MCSNYIVTVRQFWKPIGTLCAKYLTQCWGLKELKRQGVRVFVLLLAPDRRKESSDADGFGGARRDHVRSNG